MSGPRYPTCTVTIGGVDQTALEWSTQHSVEAPLAQASIVLPSPPPTGVFEGAAVRIKVIGDTGEDERTAFEGRVRGPLEWSQTESDATVTARCDGNLWRANFPATWDMSWVGPITPRKLIRQLLAFCGIDDYHVEEFVHPTTGVPLLLGGVPWFDDGRIVLSEGTTPLDFMDRLCRLFGYRIYDRPDGRIRVSRVCGPPRQPDYTLTEGVDLLGPKKNVDLHAINTYIVAQGASGTDPGGAQINVISRPKRGIHSHFIPNPPKYANASVSDPLLVTQYLADAARIVAEFDQAGPAWRFTSEVIGAGRGPLSLAPNMVFQAVAPTIGLGSTGKRFWQISVSNQWGPGGFWTTIDGWRPTGKPARTARPDPVDDPTDPPTTAPDATDLGSTPDPATGDLTGADTPLPTGYDVAPDDEAYNPLTDPDGAPPELPAYDPTTAGPGAPGFDDPTATDAPYVGDTPFCPPAPAAPPRTCQTIGLTEPGWEDALSGDDRVPGYTDITIPIDTDTVTITGEQIGDGGTITLNQYGSPVGTGTLPDADPVEWTPFSVEITAALDVGADADGLDIALPEADGTIRGVDVQLCGGKPCAIPTPPAPAGCVDCEDADWSTAKFYAWPNGAASVSGGTFTFSRPGSGDPAASIGCRTADCDVGGDWTLVVDGQTSGPEQSVRVILAEYWYESGDAPEVVRVSPYVNAIWGGSGATTEYNAFETDGSSSAFIMDDNTVGYRLQPDVPFRLTIQKTGGAGTAHFQYQGQQPIGTTVFDFAGDGDAVFTWDGDVEGTKTYGPTVEFGRLIGLGVRWATGVDGETDTDATITNVAFAFG